MTQAATVPRLAPQAVLATPQTTSGPTGPLTACVLRGEPARSLLEDPSFEVSWDALARRCPWATVFQRRDFVSIWMDVYEDAFAPVVVAGFDPDGTLAGLFALAEDLATGELVVAGTHHCEYPTWLADPGRGEEFGSAAFDALAREFPRGRLLLRWLAPGTPAEFLTKDAAWRRRSVAHTSPRALHDLAGGDAAKSLRKKSNRSRLNRLRRHGEVTFERVEDPASFARLLDEAVPMYDLRQGAIHEVLPFAQDPEKRAFHERWMARTRDLHVTALRVGGKLAAAHFGIVDGRAVRVGVFAHSPFFAAESPGKLHLLLLAQRLAEDGFELLDLTPGAGWKERFATRTDVLTQVTIHFRAADAVRLRRRIALEGLAKRAALAAGTTPNAVRAAWSKLRSVGIRGVAARVAQRLARVPKWFGGTVEYRLYTFDAEKAAKVEAATRFATNRLEDLLLFLPMESWQTRRGFLAETLERLENGDRVFTYVEDGKLLSYGWLRPRQERSYNSEVRQEVLLPPGAAVAFDYHTHPLGRGKGLHKSALATALREGASIEGTAKVWTGVLADNGPSRHNCEKMGWDYHASLWMRTRFGRRLAGPARRSFAAPLTLRSQVLGPAKRLVLRVAKACGLFGLAKRATRGDLRILAYHGFESGFENGFGPKLFMKPETFERRLDALVAGGYPVVPLDDAVRRLADGTLPPAAVVLTIDDGTWNVLPRAVPALLARRLPATFYATSYYVEHRSPVFRVALQYALWRTHRDRLLLAGLGPFTQGEIDLADEGAREVALWELIRHGETRLLEPGRVRLAHDVFVALGLDWDEFARSRICGLMTKDELAGLVARGFDLELHTHRHRLPVSESAVRREVEDNRAVLEPIAGRRLVHLCYPSNEHVAKHEPWLTALGIASATTCDHGLNPRGTNPLALRRFLDGESTHQIEFEAEVSGFAELCRRATRAVRALPSRVLRKRPS